MSILDPDLNAPTMDEWMRIRPLVNRMGDELESLIKKYGTDASAVAISIYWESMPESILKRAEQFRYQNTKYMQKIHEADKSLTRKLR